MVGQLRHQLRVDGLVATIGGLMISSPLVAVEILVRLGPIPLADWFFHFAAMTFGAAVGSDQSRTISKALAPSLPAPQRFALERVVDGWQYGSGMDYTPPAVSSVVPPEALARAKRAAAAARAFRSKTGEASMLA